MKNDAKKKYIAMITMLTLTLGVLCGCGGSGDSDADATEATKASTVIAGEAAKQEAEKDAKKEATTAPKTGTEDPAIDAIKAAAYKDIKGFDGKWENIEMEDYDTTIVMRFDWKGKQYEYTYDLESGKITE